MRAWCVRACVRAYACICVRVFGQTAHIVLVASVGCVDSRTGMGLHSLGCINVLFPFLPASIFRLGVLKLRCTSVCIVSRKIASERLFCA